MARVVLPGIPHHVTQRGVRGMDIFRSELDRLFYLKMMKQYCNRYSLSIVTWCLMSNHVHLIAVPDEKRSLAKAVGEAHKGYTGTFNKRNNEKGFLFGGRFFSTPMDRQHFYAAVRYVLRNPVRAGIVEDPMEYRWSSVRFNAGREEQDPLIESNDRLNWVTHWEEYLKSDPEEIDVIRASTRTGRPCGGEEFLTLAETITGRDLRKHSPGPKSETD